MGRQYTSGSVKQQKHRQHAVPGERTTLKAAGNTQLSKKHFRDSRETNVKFLGYKTDNWQTDFLFLETAARAGKPLFLI